MFTSNPQQKATLVTQQRPNVAEVTSQSSHLTQWLQRIVAMYIYRCLLAGISNVGGVCNELVMLVRQFPRSMLAK